MRPTKDELHNFWANLPKEEIQINNSSEEERYKKEFEEFNFYYDKGECFLCKKNFKTFSKENPCIHSLLRRNSFKKKDFPDIFNKFEYHNISTYLKWIANRELYLTNINNLLSEKHSSKKFEYTIKWKNIDWTFSCSNTDFLGHDGQVGFPHYHFKMRIDGRPFIDFTDFHIPFSGHDLFIIDAVDNGYLQYETGSAGAGVQDVFDLMEQLGDESLDVMKQSKSESESPFHIGTIIEGPISGDWFAEVVNEANKQGRSIASVIREKQQPHMRVQTYIEPSESIPEIPSRKNKKNTK